ncbi:MAG: DUF433 domain-containing protein [Gemmatimonadetes bacterium]|nr:DUF433 domain-containing protein [Gemmatimonadota bacterium]
MIDLVGRGIFTVEEAARLLRESPAGVRRWAFGYERCRAGRAVHYPPLIVTELPEIEGGRALTFLELVELMCIRGFRRAGVRWHLVRRAAATAARVFGTSHPFALRRFFVDPAGIYGLLEEEDGSESLLELSGGAQYALDALIRPYLGQLDFDPSDIAERWWPLGHEGRIAVDPRIAFGHPTIAGTGIPAETLAAAVDAERGDRERVAWLYRIPVRDVDAALRFREWLAAA